MKTTALAIAATIAAFCLIGCGKKGVGQPTNGTATQTVVSTAVARSQTMCPLMARKINKDFHADYQGKRVFFCCKGCVSTFNASPEKYVKKLTDQGITLEIAPLRPEPKDEGSSTN